MKEPFSFGWDGMSQWNREQKSDLPIDLLQSLVRMLFWGNFSPHQHLLQKNIIRVWLKHPLPLHNPGNDGFWGLWVGWALLTLCSEQLRLEACDLSSSMGAAQRPACHLLLCWHRRLRAGYGPGTASPAWLAQVVPTYPELSQFLLLKPCHSPT